MNKVINALCFFSLFNMVGCDPDSPSFIEVEAQNPNSLLLQEKKISYLDYQPKNIDLKVNLTQMSSSLDMTYSRKSFLDSKFQLDRNKTIEKIQGTPGAKVSEWFSNDVKKADILFVVDNSSSMTNEQRKLSGKLSAILSSIKKSDWQIGVVSTDSNDPCNKIKMIRKQDRNPSKKFKEAINGLGVEGDHIEKGIFKAKQGLLPCDGISWVRDDSLLSIVIVSDEDNCSDGNSCFSRPYQYKEYLLDYLSSIRTVGTNAKVHGLIKTDENSCHDADRVGYVYKNLIAETNGLTEKICQNNYKNFLEEISKDIQNGLSHSLTLSNKPLPTEDIDVLIDSIPLDRNEYSVLGDVVVFKKPLQNFKQVKISYVPSEDSIKKEFFLADNIDEKSLVVSVNGINVSNYSLSDGSVYFDDFPKYGAKLKFSFRVLDKLRRKFKFELSDPDFYQRPTEKTVFVNDWKIDRSGYDFYFDNDTAFIEFSVIPPDGAKITLDLKGEMKKQLAYNLAGFNGKYLKSIDSETSEEVDASFDESQNKLNISEFEFKDGRKIDVIFNRETMKEELRLDQGFLKELLSISRDSIRVCENSATISTEGVLDLKKCLKEIGTGDLKIQYGLNKPLSSILVDWKDLGLEQRFLNKRVKILVNQNEVYDWEKVDGNILIRHPINYKDEITCRIFSE